jgi:hypothetical protein
MEYYQIGKHTMRDKVRKSLLKSYRKIYTLPRKQTLWDWIACEILRINESRAQFYPSAVIQPNISVPIFDKFLSIPLFFRTSLFIAILTLLAAYAYAQNKVTGNLQSLPSMTPAYSGITLKQIDGQETAHTESDSTTGKFSLDVPSGTYEMIIKTKGHRRYIDTITVNGNLDLDTLPMIQSIKTTSTYYTDQLDLANCLIDGYGSKGRKGLPGWHNDLRPIRIFHENMPTDTIFRFEYNQATTDISNKTNSTAKFREADTDSVTGVKFEYRPRSQIPLQSAGYTTVDSYNDDLTPKHMTVLIANDQPYINVNTFLRELCRVLRLFNTSPDPNMIMFSQGALVNELSIDEGHAIELLNKLKLNTDTRKYKDYVDTTITEVKNLTNKLQPNNFKLEQNYPNPFNAETIIQYTLKDAAKVSLKVYDIEGRLVRELVDERQGPGTYQRRVEMKNKATGTYLYEMIIKDKNGIKKSTGKMLYIQ